ncbi:MAG: hypothetical protein SPG13_02940 [Peptostreptococcus porci]|uniref:hypothetical protein n=1 Tax=Peptostreptococcus porci TaxID=2652282 RepID=UPI002A75ABED|nr:hypothetical protein [Peptostreptococcus porci]MDY2795142.1 hypothetical protein [Peptostreptococcus porci]MDY5479393.1 hypothetical protein [Peptostreptococcus porci]
MISEFKKINQNQIIIVLSLFCILISIVLPLFFINGYETYGYSSGKEVNIVGLEGLKYKKNQVRKISGYIDQENIREILEYANKFSSDNDTDYMKTEQKYPGMYYFLQNAYSSYGEENSFSIKDIDSNETLKEAQKNKVKTKMYASGESLQPAEEEVKIFELLEKNDNPIRFDFVDQWPIIIKSLIFTYGAIIFLAIIMASRLFSVEKNTKMDKIINQRNIEVKQRIIVNKLKMFYGYILLVFLLCTLTIFAIVLIPLGIQGIESQIQIIPDLFSSIYLWSIGEMISKYILGAFLSICAIGGFGILINYITKNDLSTFMLTICFSVFPIILKSSLLNSYKLSKIIQIFPVHGVNVLSYMDSLSIYSLGDKVFLPYYLICLVSIVIFIMSNYIILRKSKMN